ncbi:MAG: dihydroorotate dehydrogenase [Desulfobulbaceae bacterium]|nr:dihydroorotate dehydrogenase [Desulfobulbaceae bacterium]
MDPINTNHSVDMRVTIGDLQLGNPVMTASGTFGYGREFASLVDLNRLGAIIVKGISQEPRPGNPPPRIIETACGMLNAIGLENVGVERFITDKLPYLQQFDTPVIVNVLGESIDDYANLAARLERVEGIAAVEVNISCPNVRKGGVAFGTDATMAAAVTSAVRQQTRLPVIVKLSPNVTDVCAIARAVEDAGADAVSLINTLLGMSIDIKTRKPRLANVVGGLSGPAIKPVALRMVWQTAKAVAIPVIGIGGIGTTEDALEFLMAGATAVQVGTANFYHPTSVMDIVDGLEQYVHEQGMASVRAVINSLQV